MVDLACRARRRNCISDSVGHAIQRTRRASRHHGDSRLNPEQRELAETVRDSGEALLTIINDILDFSKIEAGKLDLEIIDFDLRAAVEVNNLLIRLEKT